MSRSIEDLTKLGFVRESEGLYLVNNTHVDLRPKGYSRQIAEDYLRSQLERSMHAFQNKSSTQANFFSHTFAIETESFELFIDHIRAFIDSLAKTAQPQKTEKVVQLNIQYFPLIKADPTT